MIELLILTLIITLTAIVVIVLGLTGQIRLPRLSSRSELRDSLGRDNNAKSQVSCQGHSNQITEPSELPDPRVLNCRIQLTKQEEADCLFDVFTVEICTIQKCKL
jgi:hypothetical protein